MLEGKVALVTGGAQGIGKGVALCYAKEKAKVVIADFNEEIGTQTVSELRNIGYEVSFVKADVTKEEEVKKMVDFVVNTYGKLDCACNNAGITNVPESILDVDEFEFERVMELDVKGMFFCLKEEIKAMRNNKSGAIVNISSTSGIVGTSNMTPYNTAKHAVIGLTKSVALEECKNGIRINTVCPGATLTPLVERQPKEAIDKFCSQIPIGRMATIEEIGNVVLFLSSNMSTYVIGETLVVDGGVTII